MRPPRAAPEMLGASPPSGAGEARWSLEASMPVPTAPSLAPAAEIGRGEGGREPKAPTVRVSVVFLQILLGEDSDVGILSKVKLGGDAHDCLCPPVATKEHKRH